jgi:hypothetical protein
MTPSSSQPQCGGPWLLCLLDYETICGFVNADVKRQVGGAQLDMVRGMTSQTSRLRTS